MNPAASLLYADQLLLITAAASYLREGGLRLEINSGEHLDHNDGRIRYASRVDFFRLMQMQDLASKGFNRRPGKDRFIAITPYNSENYITVGKSISGVVIANTQVDYTVRQVLEFCLYEIMDNVLIHAAYPAMFGGKGWCSAQFFPGLREIRLMICDTGIGIHSALTRPSGSSFKNLSEEQSLRRCVQRGVTNGEGMGFGLFATLEFIRQNLGELLIYSGSHFGTYKADSKAKNNAYIVKKGAYWPGTMVFMRIRTDVQVDYSSFLPKDYPLAADYGFFHGAGNT